VFYAQFVILKSFKISLFKQDALTISVQEDHANHHEDRVVVELACRVLGPREPAQVVAHPDGHEDDRRQP